MHMGNRIKEWRKKRDWSQQELADKVGFAQSTLGGLESGRNPGSAYAAQIAAALGVDALWLATGKGDPDPTRSSKQQPVDAGTVMIPQYNTGGKMGHGLVLRDQPGVIRAWHVSPDWVRHNIPSHTGVGNLCIVTGFGPSMMPMFNPGDPLLIDTGVTTVEFDAVYFFALANEGFIKLVQRVPENGRIRLRAKSKNQDYDPFWIDESMGFKVFGRVLRIWKGENT